RILFPNLLVLVLFLSTFLYRKVKLPFPRNSLSNNGASILFRQCQVRLLPLDGPGLPNTDLFYKLLLWLLLIQASLPVIRQKNLFYSEHYVLFRCYFHSLLQIKAFEKLPLPAPFVNDLTYERCREPIWLTHDQWPPLATACQHLALLEYVLSLASVQITR